MSEFIDLINIVLVIVMALLGVMFKVMHGQAIRTLDAIDKKLDKVDAHSESLAAGRERFEAIGTKLEEHDETFKEHGKRLHRLETKGNML